MKRLYLALAALVGAILLATLDLTRCPAPAPPTPPPALASPTPAAQAIASSSTVATLTNDLEIIVPRSPTPKAITLKHHNEADQRVITTPETDHPEEPIIIRIKQTATAAASSEASASAKILEDSETRLTNPREFQDHARLGAFVGTVPGALALTYQVAAVEIPPWLLGTPLELGLEVEGNTQQLGAGVSLGEKAFAAAGGYVGWDGPGWYLGLGMRF